MTSCRMGASRELFQLKAAPVLSMRQQIRWFDLYLQQEVASRRILQARISWRILPVM
jgi:hypothetical protein